jgi:hypothetical protein
MLCEAAVDGAVEKVKLLLAHGADGTQGTVLHTDCATLLLLITALIVLSHY